MGLCVKVMGIKLRNDRSDNDMLSERDDEALEDGQADDLVDHTKA